jgi:hydrogenase maturation protein HypF
MNLLYHHQFTVVGTVQGVGFRPFVARLAAELQLTGTVRNTTSAVLINVEGPLPALTTFRHRLETELPPAALIEHLTVLALPLAGYSQFSIAPSTPSDGHSANLPPDLALCADCRHELFNPTGRRFRYPFLNCTNCGPRYTVVRQLPYDRSSTTLAPFPLCSACQAEYDNPADRRFHAQPIACPQCGPQLQFHPPTPGDPLALALQCLAQGQIGAIRGLGGFHLACHAFDDAAVHRLRQRKARGDQPFALMVRDLATAARWVHLTPQAEALLLSPAAPIVLLPARHPQAQILAPGNGYVGLMLASTPLHALLLAGPLDSLVMTSGNRHSEPIAATNAEALQHLAGLADFFLLHNREIAAPCDDSVVRLYRQRPLAIRRARGYAPLPLHLPVPTAPILAVGADLKSTFGLATQHRALISPHIGDLENLETQIRFEAILKHLQQLHHIEPTAIIHDAHPGYHSTLWARRQGLPTLAVQHHRAHAAAVAAEYGLPPDTPVIAVIFDGAGYGDDGAIWGGEFFHGPISALSRFAHLPTISLPGGDAAARRPAIAAFAHLTAAGVDLPCPGLAPNEQSLLRQQLSRGFRCYPTSSMGRLFDAAASLLNIRHINSFEAQAAIELEARSQPGRPPYDIPPWHLPALWRSLHRDPDGPSRFHATIAAWTVATVLTRSEATVILSGGVFQNVLLLETITSQLESAGRHVLTPRYLPPNDGGLALGQLYLAALSPLQTVTAPRM